MIQKHGVWLQWLQRTSDLSDAYNTGSETYGYGDPLISWTTGSVKATVEHVSAKDVVLEIGFYEDDYERIWVDADEDISLWDQIILPSGSTQRYIVLSRHTWRINGDILISKNIIIRRLIPRSGSTY